jgi:hypothetical protein
MTRSEMVTRSGAVLMMCGGVAFVYNELVVHTARRVRR